MIYYLKLKQNGEIVTRFNELNDISINIYNIILDISFNILLCIIISLLLTIKSLKFTFLLILFTFIYSLFNIIIYKKLIKTIKYSLSLESDYNSNIVDYISKISTIKNLNIYDYFINNINNNLESKNNINKSINKKIYKINFFNSVLLNIIMLITLNILIKNNYDITNSLLIYMLVNYYINVVKSIIDYYPTIIIFKSIIRKNSDFLSFNKKKLPLIQNKFNTININDLKYSINGKIILNNINLFIKKEDKVFLQGPSGSGKSTLMKILNNEITNYKGRVMKDNYDIKKYDVSPLITYTHQDESLFNDTILNNILLGKDIDKLELDKVLNICRLNDINVIKEVGLNSLIINNSSISGGERNRIILARSLVHSKNILILDEILKEVDYKLEVDIIKDIIKCYKEKTIIYISHKNVGFLFKKVLTLGKE